MVTGRPAGGQHCRRSCSPSTARRWHGFCSAAIFNPAYRETDKLATAQFWSAQCGGYAERRILGCDAVQCGTNLARFRNKLLPLSSGRWNSWGQKVTFYWGHSTILWLFHLLCILYCSCFTLFCDVWVCLCVGFVMFGCVYVWVCNVWVCVCVGFVTCGCVCVGL